MNSDPDVNKNVDIKLKQDLKRICRICLAYNNYNELISFKCQFNGLFNDIKIFDLYRMASALSNDEETALNKTKYSKKICQNCLNDLIKYVKFKNKIELAETILKYYINEGCNNGMILEPLHDEESNVKIIITSSNSNQQFNEGNDNDYYHNDFCNDNDSVQNLNEMNQNFELISDTNNVNNDLLFNEIQQNQIELNMNSNVHLDSLNPISENYVVVQGLTRFKCHECLENFKFEEDLNLHSSIHSKDLKCNKCNKIFNENRQLRRHIKIHLKDMPFKCVDCNNKGFPEINALTRHIKTLHSKGKKIRKFVCNEINCFKKYYDSYSLKVHQRIHRNEKPYKCNQCNKQFNDIRLLNSHIKTHLDEKKYCCKYCDKKFTHGSTLNSHIRTHTHEKPYICVICNKHFCQSSNLRTHMITHTKDKLHDCKCCDKKYTTSSALNFHLRTHKEKQQSQYNCKICLKKFSRPNLTAHMRIHKNEKPFKCEQCSSKFRTKSQMKMHYTTIHLKENHNKKIDIKKPNLNENLNKVLIEEDQLLNENLILVNTLLDNINENFSCN